MLTATCIAIFIIPMLFVLVERLAARLRRSSHVPATALPHPHPTGADD
jgi:hypothetical protein